MTQGDVQYSACGPIRPRTFTIEACRADDAELMEQAIFLASQPNSPTTPQEEIQYGLQRSAARSAIHVLRYVLDRGADVGILSARDILVNDYPIKPSQAVVEMLVAHGWDIDTRRAHLDDSWPLLWSVARYHDLVVWCLDHGARVDVPNYQPQFNADGTQNYSGRTRNTLLGLVASSGSVETFELLRAKGAPFDPRVLHRAVEHATYSAPRDGDNNNSSFEGRMAMVRHLVDVLKLDVNSVQHQVADHRSTPLCYAASRPTQQNFRELVHFLLDRGADLYLKAEPIQGINWPSPIECGQHNERFLQAVEEWQARKQGDGTG